MISAFLMISKIFVLQFYKSVCLNRNLNGTLSIAFIIRKVKITFLIKEFTRIIHVPCRAVCVFTSEWAISSLPNGIDSNIDIYPPPIEDPLLIHDALFNPRPPGKTRKVKGVDVTLDPFQMVIFELKTNFKKWEIILGENAISLTGNKDHPNVCLCYMLYYLAIGKHFNLAYYRVNIMVSMTKSVDMTLPNGMLFTQLVERICVSHPHALSDDLYLMDHVMTPLYERSVFRIMPGEYGLRLMRIEQYFLMTDYSLWEVIKNGNKVLKRTVRTSEETYEPTSAEEKLDRRNEMKSI
nr:hypothetical protein [Tanacetum cinerariifolium]